MSASAPLPEPAAGLVRRHLRFGWWSVLVFLTLGLALEVLHGFKLGWYLDAANETRRLALTLAHAHGVLLGLVNLGFALTVRAVPERAGRWQGVASPCLIAAGCLLPGGFLLGGLVVYGGDPGLGILLTPIGGVLLLVGVWRVARGLGGRPEGRPSACSRSRCMSSPQVVLHIR